MRHSLLVLAFIALPLAAGAQAQGKFPPDSLINVKIFPKTTPVPQVLGAMRSFSGSLGVRCQFCHVGREGQPLGEFDFASDEKRMKLVARQMMSMVQEINRRVDSLPGRTAATGVNVSCETCHRGVSRPAPLATVVAEIATASGADSAVRAYKALRTRYYGRAAYDFGEVSLSNAATRLGGEKKFDEALALLTANDEHFPTSSGLAVVRGNVILMRGDTAGAERAFREAIRRDSTNNEARGRLRAIGRQP